MAIFFISPGMLRFSYHFYCIFSSQIFVEQINNANEYLLLEKCLTVRTVLFPFFEVQVISARHYYDYSLYRMNLMRIPNDEQSSLNALALFVIRVNIFVNENVRVHHYKLLQLLLCTLYLLPFPQLLWKNLCANL